MAESKPVLLTISTDHPKLGHVVWQLMGGKVGSSGLSESKQEEFVLFLREIFLKDLKAR